MNISEEPDGGKLHVRFREGYSKSLTLINRNLLTKGRDLDMSTRQNMKHEEVALIEIVESFMEKRNIRLVSKIIEELNWEELLRISYRQKVFPIVYKSIYDYIPIKYQAKFDQKYYNFIMNIKISLFELNRIVKLAQQNNISVVLLKGLALAKIIYNDIYIRQFGDIDLLVNEADMEKMYYLLSDIGFAQEIGFDKNTKQYITIDKPIYTIHSKNHEFKCVKDLGNEFNIFVEIKRASSAIPQKYIDDFHRNVQNINLEDLNIKTSDLTYTFIHLCANFFHNFESSWGALYDTNLRDIVDIVMLIFKYGCNLDWTNIHQLSHKYEITHKIHYVFISIKEVFGDIISNEVIQLFSPDNNEYSDDVINKWENDFIFRLFNDEERKQEFIKIKKLKAYNEKGVIYDEAENESDIKLTELKEYRHFIIEPLQWDIEYIFTYDINNLYFYVIIKDKVYEQLTNYKLDLFLLDNNLSNAVSTRIISITLEDTFKVLCSNIQQCDWQFLEAGDKKFIKIYIPFNYLDMNFKDSDGRISHNIFCKEKIGSDGFCIIAKKYEPEEYGFLKIHNDNFKG